MEKARVKNIGQLRPWADDELLRLRSFGVVSVRDVRWFYAWTEKLDKGTAVLPNVNRWMKEFLRRQELFVLEQRFGLRDLSFRPDSKLTTLQQIANRQGGLTRERARQVEEAGLLALQSRLARALGKPIEDYFRAQIQKVGGAIAPDDLGAWAKDEILDGYSPCGVLLLLSASLGGITCRNNFYTIVPADIVASVEKQAIQILRTAGSPVPLATIVKALGKQIKSVGVQPEVVLRAMLNGHPDLSCTINNEYFITTPGCRVILTEILKKLPKPTHFHAITKLYNERMQPHSHKGTGYILRELGYTKSAAKFLRAYYELKTA